MCKRGNTISEHAVVSVQQKQESPDLTDRQYAGRSTTRAIFVPLNRTMKGWYTCVVTLSDKNGLSERLFA